MRKLSCVFGVVILCSFFAVHADAQKSMIGVRAGVNLANLSFDSTLPSGITKSMHAGLIAGLQYDYWFDDMWAISVQALYDQKGTHLDINSNDFGFTESGTVDILPSYLEIPVLLKASFGTGTIRPYVFAGPSIGILLAANEKVNETFTSSGISETQDTTGDIKDSLSSIDFSIVAGVGVSYTLSSGTMIFLDAGYAIGISDIDKNNSVEGGNIKTNDIRIAAGVMFPL
ncbi:MAG TPA: porin family protein [Candidatus Kapabacteria bacterium]|jgi:hypothetical protein|nr:porin family protein [Candidatus Kapabacteria bacterium]